MPMAQKTDAEKVAKLREMAKDKSLPQEVRNQYLDQAVKIEEKAAKAAGVRMAKGGAVKTKKMAVGGSVEQMRQAMQAMKQPAATAAAAAAARQKQPTTQAKQSPIGGMLQAATAAVRPAATAAAAAAARQKQQADAAAAARQKQGMSKMAKGGSVAKKAKK